MCRPISWRAWRTKPRTACWRHRVCCRECLLLSFESPEDWAGLQPALIAAVGDAAVLRKSVFDLSGDLLVRPAVRAADRRTAVLIGLETDVCVARSALGLFDDDDDVVVVDDVVGSPGNALEAGLDRMRRAGVIPVVAKQLHYEWMRTVAQSRAFHAAHPGFENPPGVLL